MERGLKLVVMMLYLAVVGFEQSSGARWLGNDIFVTGLRNPSIFNPNLNVAAGLLYSAHKSSLLVPSDEALKVWGDQTKESVEAEEIVLNVAAKGSVRPSENGVVKMQQLSTSTPSPGVGHMQIFASIPKPPLRSNWERRQQEHDSEKRILQSTPSPGDGN